MSKANDSKANDSKANDSKANDSKANDAGGRSADESGRREPAGRHQAGRREPAMPVAGEPPQPEQSRMPKRPPTETAAMPRPFRSGAEAAEISPTA